MREIDKTDMRWMMKKMSAVFSALEIHIHAEGDVMASFSVSGIKGFPPRRTASNGSKKGQKMRKTHQRDYAKAEIAASYLIASPIIATLYFYDKRHSFLAVPFCYGWAAFSFDFL